MRVLRAFPLVAATMFLCSSPISAQDGPARFLEVVTVTVQPGTGQAWSEYRMRVNDAAERLGVELTLPASAEVANAFGAVMGSVVQRASVLVTQPLHGQFIVHGDRGPIHFSSLDEAVSTAEEIVRARVGQLAREAGADSVEIRLNSEDKHIHHDVDGDLFLETRITATATGRPRIC